MAELTRRGFFGRVVGGVAAAAIAPAVVEAAPMLYGISPLESLRRKLLVEDIARVFGVPSALIEPPTGSYRYRVTYVDAAGFETPAPSFVHTR